MTVSQSAKKQTPGCRRRQACAVNRFKKKAVTKCPAAICDAGHPVTVPSGLHTYSRNGSAVFKFLITASSHICHL